MRELTIQTPRELGAARIKLIGPHGLSIEDFNTPTNTTTVVPEAEYGDYLAIVEPIGQRAHYSNFTFDEDSGVIFLDVGSPTASTEDPEARSPVRMSVAQMANLAKSGVTSLLQETLNVMAEKSADPWFFLGDAAPSPGTISVLPDVPDEPALLYEEPDSPVAPRILRVGLSRDVRPFDPGGWRPADQSMVIRSQEEDALVFRFDRPNDFIPPPEFARLRLSATISGGTVQRMLIPLFSGGTKVVVRENLDDPTELDVRIFPEDPEKLSLAQVLASGLMSEGELIFQGFTRERSLETYILDEKIHDPWTGILGAMVSARFSIGDPRRGYPWVNFLARHFNWISDALILEAHRLMTIGSTGDDDWPRRRQRALAALKRARRLGAPYFFFANALAMDLLAALAGAPVGAKAESHGFAEDVAVERGRWQSFLQHQGSSGAFFIWKSRAWSRPDSGFDPRYTETLYEQQLA